MLTPVQGSSCKGRSAIDQVTQQIVKMEIIQLNQQLALDFFLDLWHCFNYMVEACHNLACWWHGAVDDYFHLHAQTHCMMWYYVWHQYGISLEYNTYANHPWRAGQGTTNAALQYIALSNLLIDAYYSEFQPHVLHDHMLTLQIIKRLKSSLTMLPWLQVTNTSHSCSWLCKHNTNCNGGTNLFNPQTVCWIHRNAVVLSIIDNQINMASSKWQTPTLQTAPYT